MRRLRKHGPTLLWLAGFLLAAFPAWAVDHGSAGGTSHEMSGQAAPAATAAGKVIAHRTVQGHMLMYHLLDLKERAILMKGMEGMDMPGMSNSPDVTNHLVVYISGPDGKPVSGTVGFQVTGPDGKTQSTLTMGMRGGYGADVLLGRKGAYIIKTKAAIGGTTLLDQFTHEVK